MWSPKRTEGPYIPSLYGAALVLYTHYWRVIIINTAFFHSQSHPINIIRIIWSVYLRWMLTEREKWVKVFHISMFRGTRKGRACVVTTENCDMGQEDPGQSVVRWGRDSPPQPTRPFTWVRKTRVRVQSGEAGIVHRNLPELLPGSGGPGSECSQVRPGQSTATYQTCHLSQEDPG